MEKKKVVIGIAEGSHYEKYEKWICQDENVQAVRLSYHLDNIQRLEECDAILFTGGNDVNPRVYNQPDFLVYCNPDDLDEKRDEFEWKVMQYVEENQLPLLGICRGMHFVNVFYGGSLIPDIPAFGKFNHGKRGGNDSDHTVTIDQHSNLFDIIGNTSGTINSSHHQGVDMPGFGLVTTALSPDGIIEAMERKEQEGRSFFLLIQWHPERMENPDDVFSKKVRERFISAIRGNEK